MGKKGQINKPAYSRHLEELLKEQNLKKKELAAMIYTSAQTISKACNGVRLTPELANDIIGFFPEYNIAWLLGFSEIKLKKDADMILVEEHEDHINAAQQQETIFDTIARLGNDVGFETSFNGTVFTVEPSKELSDQGYEPISLTFKDNQLNEFQEDIVAYIKYRFESLIKRRH